MTISKSPSWPSSWSWRRCSMSGRAACGRPPNRWRLATAATRWCRRRRGWRARRSGTAGGNWRRAWQPTGAHSARRGGPSRHRADTQPGVKDALEPLVEPLTRGDPMSPLRWTCKSRAKLAAALTTQGWRVSSTTVGRLLHALGYRLQALRKSREGTSHPDRNAQFEHINATAAAFLQRQQPVISVDTKKKELVGDFKNAGQEWQPTGTPEPVLRARFSRRRDRQSDSVRRLRHGAQRSVGERGPRPRHARVRRRLDSPVVDDDGPAGLSASRRLC